MGGAGRPTGLSEFSVLFGLESAVGKPTEHDDKKHNDNIKLIDRKRK